MIDLSYEAICASVLRESGRHSREEARDSKVNFNGKHRLSEDFKCFQHSSLSNAFEVLCMEIKHTGVRNVQPRDSTLYVFKVFSNKIKSQNGNVLSLIDLYLHQHVQCVIGKGRAV